MFLIVNLWMSRNWRFLGEPCWARVRSGLFWWLNPSWILDGTCYSWNCPLIWKTSSASISIRYIMSNNIIIRRREYHQTSVRNDDDIWYLIFDIWYLIFWQSALLSAFPYLALWFFNLVLSKFLDIAKNRNWLGATGLRKLSNSVGNYFQFSSPCCSLAISNISTS